jgi:hypothetical protein
MEGYFKLMIKILERRDTLINSMKCFDQKGHIDFDGKLGINLRKRVSDISDSDFDCNLLGLLVFFTYAFVLMFKDRTWIYFD